MKEFHFFDLDWTLWDTNSKLSVINKNRPEKVIYKIDPMYEPMLKTYWKKDNLLISYNGETWWISKDIWNSIKRKNKNIKLEDLGISYREWKNEEIIEKQKRSTNFFLSNLEHLEDRWDVKINILTARGNKKEHKSLLKELKKKVYRKIKKEINRIYFVGDFEYKIKNDSTAIKKCNILLEHLIGYKIKNNKFVNFKKEKTNIIHFYDDNDKNINYSKNLQEIFEKHLKETDPILKKKILNRIQEKPLIYYTHLITSNYLKPFETTKCEMMIPNKVNYF